MEQRRKARNLIIVLLTVVGIQNVHTVDVGTTVWPQSVNTTTSIYQESTTNLPASTSIKRTEETLDSSESNVVHRYAQPSDSHEEHHEEADNSEEPSDHATADPEPDSEHEEARDVPTRPKYVAPGVWAKPPPDKNIPLNFVPSKLHAQVRGTHVVKKVPQREAIESAATDEEKSNAHRLREVVTNSKVNTVYTEEGYEDSAYDHAGHVRDADFHEGFARKLHDQQKDARKEKEEHGNLVPDEFKDYEEDYKDHLEESRKLERNSDDEYNLIGYGKSAWKGSEIDPKLVAENGIRNLEEDIEKDAEETERNAQVYRETQESRKLHDDEADSSESEESHGEGDSEDEEDESTKSEKGQSRSEKASFASREAKQSRELEEKKLHENHETTVTPIDGKSSANTETLESPRGFLTNPSSLRASVDQTTPRYVPPITTASPEVDEPTTMSYSQIFWNYFKARQTPSSTESSGADSPPEERTPIAVATIDGHGPYLLVTQQETTTSSTLFADRAEFAASSAQAHNRHLLGQSDDVDVDTVIAASTTATFTTVQPPQSLSSVNPDDAGSSTTPSDVSSGAPAVKMLNMTKEAFSRINGYVENPFLSPILNNSNIVVTKNKIKYKVLVRPEEQRKAKPVTERPPYQHFPSSFGFIEEDEYRRARDELNAKYNSIKNRQKSPFLQGKKKIIYPEDLTLLKPPIVQQQDIYPIFSIDPSAVDYSAFEGENWRSLLKDQHRPQPSVKFRVDPYIRSVPTKLLPPPPRIANIYANYRSNGKQSDNYPFYIGGKPQQQPDDAFRYLPLAPEAGWRTRFRRKRSDDEGEEFRERGGAAANVKAAAANNTVTNDGKAERLGSEGTFGRVTDRPAKRKSAKRGTIGRPASPAGPRADESGTSATLTSKKNNTVATGESENAIGKLKTEEKSTSTRSAERNERKSDTTSAEESPQRKRNVSQDRQTRSKNGAGGSDHEELLNESPKISGDVVDEEIAVRFNGKDDNETSSGVQEKGKVEVDVPDFDYVDELAEDDPVELSTTTEAAVDSKKYPFYNEESLPSASALKYMVDPRTVPQKTSRGMEFYNSRNAYRQCDAVEPALDTVLPEKEEPDPERGPQEDLPRLRGLGDKLDCLKAKYFDENPLDNPLFAEKLVVEPSPSSELDSIDSFTSQISALPKQNDEYVVPRASKKPERNGRQQWSRNRPRENPESIRVTYKYDPQTGRGRNAYMYSVRNTIPHQPARRTKNRKSRPRSGASTTQSPRKSQTASYQNQVYEDVMGNIRYLATQIYERTTPSPAAQGSLETAGSENTQQIVHITPSPPKEKAAPAQNVTEVNTMTTTTTGAKSSEIKGLLPPPKYLTPRQSTYRKPRPPSLSRVSLLKSPSLPRIIAHHHTLKINKRSVTNDTAAVKSTAVENSTIVSSLEVTTRRPDWTPDLQIAESKDSPTTLKVKNRRRRRNSTSDESPPRVVYTIRDRIRHSKPKSSATGFGKFGATSKTEANEDKRRKEPRYNQLARKKKPAGDRQNDPATLLSSTDAAEIESATSSIEGGESSPDVYYHPEESATHQMVYRAKKEHREPKTAESEESAENESTTSSYEVYENIDEDVSTASSPTTKGVQSLREYLASDPPGYAEAFPEEATTTSSKSRAKHEEEEDPDYPQHSTSPWNDDSSEKAEEQVETPMRTEVPRDDDSEEVSSKEDEDSNREQTFFAYGKRPSSAENDGDDEERSEKTSYSPSSIYKSMKKENDEGEGEAEDSEERSEDHVFPWHADESDKENENRWLGSYRRFEYPWEKRERLAEERRRKQKRANRIRDLIFDDETGEESARRERPPYPWEKYDVPSKDHANARRDVSREFSRRNIDDHGESNTERLPFAKFSSRYSSSGGMKQRRKPSTAREISRSIKKFLEEDDEFKEETSGEKKDGLASRKSSSDKEVFGEKKRRRKIPQASKNSTSLESNRLKSGEASDEAGKHVKTGNFNESQVETASQLSNSTNEVPSTIAARKKRRRKISRNNSTISLDSAPAESSIESAKRRRRKPQTSTTESAVDLDRSRSDFAPVRTRSSTRHEAARGSELNFPETSRAENLQVRTSTPKTRTIELRSRVSKEKSVKRTVYPDERDNFDSARKKNATFARKEPTQAKSKRRRKINDKQDADNKGPHNRKLTKQKNEKNHSDIRGETKTSTPPEKASNNPLENLGINRKDVKEINDASVHDGIINDESDDDRDEFWMPPETYAVSNLLMRNIPSKNDRGSERAAGVLRLNEDREYNSREEGEEERRGSLLQTKFIKEPERRLYYYVDRK